MKMVNLNHQQTKGGKKHEETDCGIRTLRGDGPIKRGTLSGDDMYRT